MSNYLLKDVVEIQFNKYNCGDCQLVKIPVFDTTRQEALQVMDAIRNDSSVGMVRAFLSNRNTI